MFLKASLSLAVLAALLLVPVPAQAAWPRWCAAVARAAGNWWPAAAPPPLPELEIRIARLFRAEWWGGPALSPGSPAEEIRLHAQLNVALLGRQGELYGTRDPRGLAVFRAGTPAEKIILITHQSFLYQKRTAGFLAQPEFRDVPRLVLTGDGYPLHDADFRRQITLLQVSHGGEMYGLHFNTSELHVAGGFSDLCLGVSLRQAIPSLFAFPGRREAKVVAHSSLIYTTLNDVPTLADLRQKLPADDYFHHEEGMVRGFLPEQGEWERTLTPGYEYVNESGQRLTIEVR